MLDGLNYLHYKNIFLERYSRIFNLQSIEETFVGIKRRNIIFNDQLTDNAVRMDILDNYSNCFLFFDWLKDKYTHIQTPINASPHFLLIHQLMANSLTKKNEYIIKLSNGILDNRYPLFYSLRYYKNKFNKSLINIENDNYLPPLVIKNSNTYYIIDGKHTVALSRILNKPVTVKVVDNYC